MDLTLILGSTKFAAYVTKKQIFSIRAGAFGLQLQHVPKK